MNHSHPQLDIAKEKFKKDTNLSLLGDCKVKLIKEIILGPKRKQEPKGLKGFLHYYGYDVDIRKSAILIR